MEKINKRVSKRHLKLSAIAISLMVLAAGCSEREKVVEVKPVEFSMTDYHKQIIKLNPEVAKPMKEVVEEKKEELTSRSEAPRQRWMNFKMTHYVSNCKGCSGITSSGHDVRNTIYYQGYRVLAVDPKLIREGSIVEIVDEEGVSFEAIALDRGGAIKGRKLDLLVKNESIALREGRKNVRLRILREGWGKSKTI